MRSSSRNAENLMTCKSHKNLYLFRLLEKVRNLRSKMREEEEAHMNATQNMGKFRK